MNKLGPSRKHPGKETETRDDDGEERAQDQGDIDFDFLRSHRVACARTRVARRVLASFAPKQKIQSRGWAKNVVASAGCRMEFSYDGTTTSTRECVLYRISMVYNVVDVCERSRPRRLFFTRSSLDAAEFRNRDAEALELLQNSFIVDGWKLGETGG